MNPEVAKKWEHALEAYRKAEHCLHAGDQVQAEREAWEAVLSGADVMKVLLPDEQGRNGISAVLSKAIDARRRPDLSAKDHVEIAKAFLAKCIDTSPPENKLWGENQL